MSRSKRGKEGRVRQKETKDLYFSKHSPAAKAVTGVDV
jgi:hypothetical protein